MPVHRVYVMTQYWVRTTKLTIDIRCHNVSVVSKHKGNGIMYRLTWITIRQRFLLVTASWLTGDKHNHLWQAIIISFYTTTIAIAVKKTIELVSYHRGFLLATTASVHQYYPNKPVFRPSMVNPFTHHISELFEYETLTEKKGEML